MAISAIAGLAAVGSAAAAAGTLAIGWTAAFTAFAIGAGLSIVSRALMPKPDFGGMLTGVTGTVREAASTRKIVYGRCRVGGSVVFIANGSGTDYLYLTICFASHEIDAYEKFYLNDELVWENGSFKDDWGSWVSIGRHFGTPDQAADSMMTGASTYWTNNHKLSGIAYCVVRLKWDKDRKKFPNGVPNVSAVIRGKKVKDVRDNVTKWTQNPALIVHDYITDIKYGLGESENNIDKDSFKAAATACDALTLVVDGPKISKWSCDGVIDTSTSIKSNIESLLASMGGRISYSGGKYFVQEASYFNPQLTIDESVMVGDLQVRTKQSRRSVYNGVKGVFLSEELNYTLADYPARISSDYSLADGEPIYLDMSLPFVTHNVRAQRLAKIALLKSRQQTTVTVPLNLAGLQLKAGDFINISNSRMGWSSKPFEVLDYTIGANDGGMITVNVNCIETHPDVYDWNTEEDPFENGTLPDGTDDGTTSEKVSNLKLTETTTFGGDGALVDAILIEWDAPNSAFVEFYELVITQEGAGTYTVTTRDTEYLTSPVVKGDNYTVTVFAVNTLGVRSDGVTKSLEPIGDTEGPGTPTGLSATGALKSVVLEWTNPSDNDLRWVDIFRAGFAGAAYSKVGYVAAQAGGRGLYVDAGLADGEDYYYYIRAVDTSGNLGGSTGVVNATTDARPDQDAPRDLRGYVYYQYAQANNPGTPSANYFDFAADSFVGLTNGWDTTPPTVSGSDPYWAARYQVIEDSYDGIQTLKFSYPFSSFYFDGLVTFENLNDELGDPGSDKITTIDGGLIKTGVIDLINDDGMAVKQSKANYESTVPGFWLGNDGGVAKFHIGKWNSYFKFDGESVSASALEIRTANGGIIMSSGGDIDGTYIKDATIETASIGNAQVQSLQIKDNAVTVPVGARKAVGEVRQTLNTGSGNWQRLDSAQAWIDLGLSVDDQPKAFNATAHAAVEESGRGWTYFAARLRIIWGGGGVVLGYTTGYCNQGSPAGIAVTGHSPLPSGWNYTRDVLVVLEMTCATQQLSIVDWSIQATGAKR